MDENLTPKRYEPSLINLEIKNSTHTRIIENTGFNKMVLEIGTPNGYISKELKERGNRVTCLEMDEESGSIGQQYCDRMILGDVETLTFDEFLISESFDVIICADLLKNKKKPATVLKKLRKFLKPNGYIVVSLPNFCHGDVLLNLLNSDFHYTSTGLLDDIHLHFFGLKNIHSIFAECGYQIKDLQTLNLNIGNTELKVDKTKIPPDLLKFIQSLPDSEVYQYIFKAYPSDCTTLPVIPEINLEQLFFDSLHESKKEIQSPLGAKIGYLNSSLADLEKHLHEKNCRIEELERFVATGTKHIEDMTDTIASLRQVLCIPSKDQHLEEISLKAECLDRQLTKKHSELEEINNYTKTLAESLSLKDTQLQNLTTRLNDLELKLSSMEQSIIWQITMKFHKNIAARLFPNNTQRGVFYTRSLQRGRILINEGFSSFYSKFLKFGKDKKCMVFQGVGNDDSIVGKTFFSSRILDKYKYDIICFPIINWDFRYQRPQQILSRLAKKDFRVFYLTTTLTSDNAVYRINQIDKNIFECKISTHGLLNIFTDTFTKEQINKFMEGFDQLIIDGGINHPICFVEFPTWEPVVTQIRKKYGGFVIFDCLDEYSDFSNINSSILNFEKKLSEISEITIATSYDLQKKCERYQNSVLLLPNAGDFEHFSNFPSNDYLRKIKKPIIGYYGAIAEWFDAELIEFLASTKPEWNFVFIGHTFGSKISRLKKYSNIHFLGEKSYEELPKYLFWFDVCLIPFRDTPLIRATHPVKFYEYLSSGKPVVSAKLPELMKYQDLCYLAENNKDFLEKIEKALKENDTELIRKRIEFAQNNTWDHRVDELLHCMEKFKTGEN